MSTSWRHEARSEFSDGTRSSMPEDDLTPNTGSGAVALTFRHDWGMTDSPFERLVAKADPDTAILDGACRLVDFWRWAFSDLVSNEVRGIFAEFIVGHALGALNESRTSWDAWDLTY